MHSYIPAVLCRAVVCRYAFFDTDNMIERAHSGETVAEIFKKYGEDYFRQCEEQVRTGAAPWGRGAGGSRSGRGRAGCRQMECMYS
jgi:hypothetical protein